MGDNISEDLIKLDKLASDLEKSGKIEEAVACYDEMISIVPDAPVGYTCKANIYSRAHRYEEALACLEKLNDGMEPDEYLAWGLHERACALYNLGRGYDAMEVLGKIIDDFPCYLSAYFSKAIMLAESHEMTRDPGDLEAAIWHYDRTVFKWDEEEEWRRQQRRRRAQHADDEIEDDDDYEDEELDGNGEIVSTRFLHVYCRRHTQELADDDDDDDNNTSSILKSTRDFDDTMRIDCAALYNKGLLLLDADKTDEAIKCTDEITARIPTHDSALTLKGDILMDSGRPAESIIYYEKSLKLHPNHPDTMFNMSKALWLCDRIEESYELLQEAHKLDPNLPNCEQILEMLKDRLDFNRNLYGASKGHLDNL